MYCRLTRFAVAGATLATGIAFATPAAAAVTYDPESRTGYVGGDDVRSAFGWTGAQLAGRAAGLVFGEDFGTDDTYAVRCGAREFPVVHHRVYGRFELGHDVIRAGGRGTARGYAGAPAGFRITGAVAGISGTAVAPGVGQPCPTGQGPAAGPTITAVRRTATVSRWALTVRSGDVQRELLARTVDAPG